MTQDRRGKRPIPDHWQLFFDQKGIRSVAHLAEITGVAGMTANRLVYGDSRTGPDVLRQVAQALHVDDAVIYGLAGWPTTTKPWEPPAESEAMTDRQRNALTELIRAFVAPALDENEPDAPDNVYDLAANRGDRTPGQAHRDHLDAVGEEPQDTP